METTNHITFDINKSSQRIDDILNAGNINFFDTDVIPVRQALSYTNGFYVYVTALFIDIVESSNMTDEHKRPVLAKMYRCFISECAAIMNAQNSCKEINIHGDCVWGVFETPSEVDIDLVFSVAAQLNSLINILNYKLEKKGYSKLSVGIGMDYGRALMVKAGFSGSGLNDVIWMGDVVNKACHLASKAGRGFTSEIVVSDTIYCNSNNRNQKFLTKTWIDNSACYEGSIFYIPMENWYIENCK